MTGLTGWLLKCVLSSKSVILETLKVIFGYLGHHFGDPGVQWDTQWTHCGPDVHFYRFWWIWRASWDQFWQQFCDFLWFGVAKWKTVSRSMFLVIQGWKWCQNAMAACPITMVTKNVFLMVSLFLLIHWFGFLRDGFGWHFCVFLCPRGHFLWFFSFLEIGLKCGDFAGVPWGGPGWEHPPRGR